MSSKQELRSQMKTLRNQMVNLENKAKEREDKLMNLFITLEPFFNSLTPDMKDKIMAQFEEEG